MHNAPRRVMVGPDIDRAHHPGRLDHVEFHAERLEKRTGPIELRQTRLARACTHAHMTHATGLIIVF